MGGAAANAGVLSVGSAIVIPSPFSHIYGAAPGNTTFNSFGIDYYSSLDDEGSNGGSWVPQPSATSGNSPLQSFSQPFLDTGNKNAHNNQAATSWDFFGPSDDDQALATYYLRIYLTSITDGFFCYNQTNSSNLGINIGVFSGDFRLQLSGGGSATNISGGAALPATVYDIQVIRRTPADWEIWVNGVMTGSGSRPGLTPGACSDALWLGRGGLAALIYVKVQTVWKNWAASAAEIAAINAQGAALYP